MSFPKILKFFTHPVVLITFLICLVYQQFFLQGKIPVPADQLVGAHYPWFDYKWGYVAGVPIKNGNTPDIYSQFFPWKYLIMDLWKKGTIPLWNQYSFSGIPLMENYHTGVFFPANLFLLLPKFSGWSIFIFGQTLLACLGMYLFLGQYLQNKLIRLTAALIFSLASLMTTWVEFGTGVWAAACLPWILYFLQRYLNTSKSKYLPLYTLFLATLFLAGNNQINQYVVVLVLTFSLVFRQNFKQLIIIGLSSVLAGGLASVQLLPAFAHVEATIRNSDRSFSKAFDYGLSPIFDLLRLYVPDFFGSPTTGNQWSITSYYENSPFLGTLTLPIILPILLYPKNKFIKYWLVVFFISIFLVTSSPITRFIYNLPFPFLTYSAAGRILFVTTLSAAILFAFGLHNFLADLAYRKLTRIPTLFLTFLLIFSLGYLKFIQKIPVNFSVSLKNSLLPLGLLFIIFMLSFLKKNRWIILVIFVLVFLDLYRYFNKFVPFVPSKIVFPTTPLIQYLQQQPGLFRVGRFSKQILPPNTWIYYKISSPEGYDPLALEGYSKLFNRVDNNFYRDSTNRYVEMYPPGNLPFMNSLNIRYFLGLSTYGYANEQLAKKYGFKQIYQDGSVVVYENPQAKERFYFVNQVIPAIGKQDLAPLIDNLKFNPENQAVVLSPTFSETKFGLGQVQVVSYRDNDFQLTTTNSQDGFLVISDAYTEGWHATIDNQPATVYQVNGGVRGLYLPAGNHTIKMYYLPDSFALGLKITITSILIWLIFFLKTLLLKPKK